MNQTLTPKVRFEGFSNSWKKEPIRNFVSKVGSGSTPSGGSKVYQNIGIPFIRSQNVFDNKLDLSEVTYITEDTHNSMKGSKVKASDLLLNITGGSIGRSCVVPKGFQQANVNQHVCIVRFDDNVVPEFAQAYLSSFSGQKNIMRNQAGGGREGINFEGVKDIKLPYTCPEEQQKIADFLSSVDEKISLLKEKHTLLTQYKKGVMQKLFKQEIRFKDDNGNDFPDWEVKKGNKVFDAISNKNHDSDLPILAITQEHGAIPRDLINYQVQVTEGSVAGYKVVDKGDFIISLRSFQGGIEYSYYKGICSPAYIILRPSIEVNDNFYRYYLKTGNFIQEMKKRLEGIRDGKILSYKYFSEISLPSPCVEEQQKIADFLLVLDKKLETVSQQIELTQTFKKGLLQQMFV